MIVLFHCTTQEAATSILNAGFRDATDNYLTRHEYTGVWLSNVPLDVNEGAKGDILLKVSLSLAENDIAPYEWIEKGKPYREWLAPAALINPAAQVAIVEEDDPSLPSPLDPEYNPKFLWVL